MKHFTFPRNIEPRSDLLVMKVGSYLVGKRSYEDVITEMYCYFDDIEQEYFICGGSKTHFDDNPEVFKYFCKNRKTTLTMIDCVLENIRYNTVEVSLVNFSNMFCENDQVDFNVFDNKFRNVGQAQITTTCAEATVSSYRVYESSHPTQTPTPSIVTKWKFDEYTDDTYYTMKKNLKLIKNVRW